EVRQRVDEALKIVDLEGMGERYVDQISGGQQQRVALARALVLKPKVLLFDEPLSNLDANLRRSMRETIRELQQRFDITSLYVTHDQAEAFAVSDTVIVMKQGDIMQIGTPQELYKAPKSMFMANFMGEANMFQGHFDGQQIHINGYAIDADLEVTRDKPNGEYQIGVRPEAITLHTQGSESQACQILKSAYMGSMYEVTVKWHDQELLLQLNSAQFNHTLTQHAYVVFNPRGLFLLPYAE
ncbi:TPA: ATP-binding cassette domain-containing protein, partial [Vibrio cholerae]